jgi:hypothetical protein
MREARIALARHLAIIMHAMLRNVNRVRTSLKARQSRRQEAETSS